MSNHTVPCSVPLDNGLTNGNSIMIEGTVRKEANNFTVQLRCPDGIAFQMYANFAANGEVVCNSELKGKKGEKEPNKLIFEEGKKFTMIITAQGTMYNIQVVGVGVFTFIYRYKDLKKTSPLEVSGDLDRIVTITLPRE